MATGINVEALDAARHLAQAEYVRLEIMINQALWDKHIPEEGKPYVLAYLQRKKADAAHVMNSGVLIDVQCHG